MPSPPRSLDAGAVSPDAGGTPKTLMQLVQQCHAWVAQGQLQAAMVAYKDWIAQHPAEPSSAVAAFNLAALLNQNGQKEQALTFNKLATQIQPRLYQAWVNLGLCQESLGQTQQALQTWQQALMEAPGQVMLLNHIGRAQEIAKDYAAAQKSLLQSLVLDPQQPDVWQHYLHLRAKQCQWPVAHTIEGLPGFEDAQDMIERLGPFGILSQSDDPHIQRACAQRFLQRKQAPIPPLPPTPSPRRPGPLRVGYLSGDFKTHAVSILMTEVFELHDRSRVQVWGFDYSDPTPTPMRQRVLAAFDHHVPLHALSDAQAAQAIRDADIDVVIDLTGLTAGGRMAILAYRAAPVQIGYLGFMGSSAMPGLTHVLADAFLVPPALQAQFAEQVLYLSCYQANDRQRAIGPTPSRASCDLPEQAFVLCAFNNTYKITPAVWRVWMRILQRAPTAHLWVLEDNPQAKIQLLRQAAIEGIGPERLTFAQRVEPQAYLARLRCADLFLDTAPYGAGTTASDALWAGLPVLTCPGRSMVSRMAGSLLMAVGLPELIASDWQDYEDKAVGWAQHPQSLQALRQSLQERRDSCRLFDTPTFVRDLEQVLIGVSAPRNIA